MFPEIVEYATFDAAEATALQAGMPAVQSIDVVSRVVDHGHGSALPGLHDRLLSYDFLRRFSVGLRFGFAVVVGDAFGKCVAVNSQIACRFGDVVGVSFEGFLDVDLFEFAHRFFEQDAAVEHLANKGFHPLSHHR